MVRFSESAVEIQLFNTGQHFISQPRPFAAQVRECLAKFAIGSGERYRFYYIPDGNNTAQRETADSEAGLSRLFEQHLVTGGLIKLYFVADQQSPPPSPPKQISAPVLPKSGSEGGSEPAHNSNVKVRDAAKCLVCGEVRDVQLCHVLDLHLKHLNFGNIAIDGESNLITLCHKHHRMFDEFDFTFVLVNQKELHKFWIVPTPTHDATLGLETLYLYKVVAFPAHSPIIPPAYLFLLKQLGSFSLECPKCPERKQRFKNTQAFLSHCGIKHHGKQVSIQLLAPCQCKYGRKTVRNLLEHISLKHMNLLVKLPVSQLPSVQGNSEVQSPSLAIPQPTAASAQSHAAARPTSSM